MGNDRRSCFELDEQVEDSNKHLLVVRTLIKAFNTVPVRVINITRVGTTTRKGDLLAKCSPVLKVKRCELVEKKNTIHQGRRPNSTSIQNTLQLRMKKGHESFCDAVNKCLPKRIILWEVHIYNTGDAQSNRQAPSRQTTIDETETG